MTALSLLLAFVGAVICLAVATDKLLGKHRNPKAALIAACLLGLFLLLACCLGRLA